MRTIERIAPVRDMVREWRQAGETIALVPTMGYLHEGHLRLLDVARARAAHVVMSLFVNPLQFGPREDLSRYPRDAASDADKARARGVEIMFSPLADEMYPGDRTVGVTPLALAEEWEGAVRPGHFTGVLTVVAKLFNIVQPDVAVFGQKDAQQLALVRAMVRDLDFPIEIATVATAREPDGLAMSSRNSYLDPPSRERATVLSRALRAIVGAFVAGVREGTKLEATGREVLNSEPDVQVDYLAVVDASRMRRVEHAESGALAIVAARVGATRLIDNMVLGA
ncbi:MAG: pantoate--beta-alanine ligase [Gemmatimonadaceae bacterium]